MKIYKYNNDYYRLVVNKISPRKRAIEEQLSDSTFNLLTAEEKQMRSLLNSLQRSKTIIREYAHCNEFNYFVTFTFDSNKIDRYDYKLIKRSW